MAALFTFEAEALTALRTPLRAEPNAIHVWAFTLEGSAECVELCRSWLSREERERADRFVFPHLRVHYTVAHGVLRCLLGRYSGMAPQELQFSTAAAGKPALQSGCSRVAPITFNLTHSETRGAIGVSVDRALGIDIERLRSNIEVLSISRNYFFGSEFTAIESAPPRLRDETFLRYWVAKEAVLKAEGVGLGFPLDRFRVDFLPGDVAARIETLEAAALGDDWTVKTLPCEAGWLGAVAARGEDWDLKLEGPC
jgi:4'-phosphopantetheinyl transferase